MLLALIVNYVCSASRISYYTRTAMLVCFCRLSFFLLVLAMLGGDEVEPWNDPGSGIAFVCQPASFDPVDSWTPDGSQADRVGASFCSTCFICDVVEPWEAPVPRSLALGVPSVAPAGSASVTRCASRIIVFGSQQLRSHAGRLVLHHCFWGVSSCAVTLVD